MHVEIHTLHNRMNTYMLSLLFMVLHLLLCIKTDSARATSEVFQSCNDITDALEVNGKAAMKMKCDSQPRHISQLVICYKPELNPPVPETINSPAAPLAHLP